MGYFYDTLPEPSSISGLDKAARLALEARLLDLEQPTPTLNPDWPGAAVAFPARAFKAERSDWE